MAELANYEEVADRIGAFLEKYPDGSLRCEKVEYKMLPAAHLDGEECLHIVYHALAYRTPDDRTPGMGKASEPIPGLTNFTRGSELMNAETSAWGRALAALGFVGKKVASANEVRAREGGPAPKQGGPKVSDKQKGMIERLTREKGVTVDQLLAMLADLGIQSEKLEEGWTDALTGGREGTASTLIERLMKGDLPPKRTVKIEPDTGTGEGFVHQPQAPGDEPWAA